MTRKSLFIAAATALMALGLPVLASAQGGYDPYGYPDRQDRVYRRNDPYNRNYDDRALRDTIRRLRDDSHRLQSDLDRDLDHSRENGSRHEDRMNQIARDLRNAADDLRNRFNERDPYRSEGEARRVLDIGSQLNRVIQHHLDDRRLYNDWSQVRSELNYIADAYGHRGNYNNGGYYPNGSYDPNGGYYPDNNQRRNDDDYRRRERNRRIADEIFRRFPN
ncbi:MAG: hypothetical protein AUG51_06870 [Acidobacteria bacterium 13_1_20CM_3_53_8]|nr:MAG: hypothetical protein AUG51_06870 [Acidobacteria bacterium 13_1_20CM_3_53_8]